MPYLSLFRSGIPPSFARLPITPGAPAAGQYWRLQWEAADRALVLPGECLCVFTAETGSDTITAVAPVPARLEIAVPNGRFLAAETTVGELCYGTELEAEFRREAAGAAAAEEAQALFCARQEALAAEAASLEREIASLRDQLAVLRGEGPDGTAAGESEPDTAASDLPFQLSCLLRLLEELPEAERRALSLPDRLRLLALLKPLRSALIQTGKRRRTRQRAADADLHRAIVALDRLYSDRLAWAADEPLGLPDTLQPKKLAIWHDLRDRHIAQRWRKGLPEEERERAGPADTPGGKKG